MKDNFSWENFISSETAKDYFKGIKFKLISDHKEGHKIFPNPKSFFRAFQLCPFQKTKSPAFKFFLSISNSVSLSFFF